MNMPWNRTNSEILSKLVRLAKGDTRLVDDAIRAARTDPSKPADLKQIIEFIVQQRSGETRLRESAF